jgi:hypothetical protein
VRVARHDDAVFGQKREPQVRLCFLTILDLKDEQPGFP